MANCLPEVGRKVLKVLKAEAPSRPRLETLSCQPRVPSLPTLLGTILRWLLLSAIRFYRLAISPFLPPACRYLPTCSEYAEEAIKVHGVRVGLWLALRRLLRCHPFHPGGYDPVPPRQPGGKRALS